MVSVPRKVNDFSPGILYRNEGVRVEGQKEVAIIRGGGGGVAFTGA